MMGRHNGVLMLAAWLLADLVAWCLAVLRSGDLVAWWPGDLVAWWPGVRFSLEGAAPGCSAFVRGKSTVVVIFSDRDGAKARQPPKSARDVQACLE